MALRSDKSVEAFFFMGFAAKDVPQGYSGYGYIDHWIIYNDSILAVVQCRLSFCLDSFQVLDNASQTFQVKRKKRLRQLNARIM